MSVCYKLLRVQGCRYLTARIGSMSGMQKAIVGLSAVGVLVLLMNMFGNRPNFALYTQSPPDESQLMLLNGNQNSETDVDLMRKLDAKLWGKPGPVLEPCWRERLPKRGGKSWGFVAVTTSNGPHNHRAQIADAVVVASQLGATLILPIIKEALKEPNSRFEDIYNIKNFISSLEGVVRVMGRLPKEMEQVNRTVTSIPVKVTSNYIKEKVHPVFRQQGGVVFLGVFLPALKGEKEDPGLTSIRCLVMHKALQFLPLIQKLGDRLLNRMREASPESSSKRFIAVDLQVDLLRHKTCNVTIVNKKRCLDPNEVGQFLRSLEYPTETAIYLTQSRWEPSLQSLQEMFPNVHTKEYSMPFNEENQYLFSGKTQFEQAVDFYVCSHSDVFIPTVPGVFYAHVAGERILAGRNHIVLPALRSKPGSTKVQVSGVISPYVEKKSHPVYHCYCEPSLSASVERSKELVVSPDLESISAAVTTASDKTKREK